MSQQKLATALVSKIVVGIAGVLLVAWMKNCFTSHLIVPVAMCYFGGCIAILFASSVLQAGTITMMGIVHFIVFALYLAYYFMEDRWYFRAIYFEGAKLLASLVPLAYRRRFDRDSFIYYSVVAATGLATIASCDLALDAADHLTDLRHLYMKYGMMIHSMHPVHLAVLPVFLWSVVRETTFTLVGTAIITTASNNYKILVPVGVLAPVLVRMTYESLAVWTDDLAVALVIGTASVLMLWGLRQRSS